MLVKEYLQQGYLLDQRINSYIMERDDLIERITCLPAPRLQERVQVSPSGEAYYEKIYEKLWDLEEMINCTVDLFVDLKKQIFQVLSAVENPDYQMVLRYKYIQGLSWSQIADEMGVGKNTVIRWHEAALQEVRLPENPIKICEKMKLGTFG